MKYCQKCKVILEDEIDICPICKTKQKSEEELEAAAKKKKKAIKTLIIVAAAIIIAAAAFVAVCLIGGKEPARAVTDEVYTEELTDNDELAQFVAYAYTAMPEVWAGSEDEINYAIEYYNTNSFPGVASGFEQVLVIRPAVGDVEGVKVFGVSKSEEGGYKITGQMYCTDGKVYYDLILSPSGYVDTLNFEQREVPFLEKARDFLKEKLPEGWVKN